MKTTIIFVLAFVAVGTAASLALPKAPPDSVLCVGSCRQNAERKFELLYSYFMEVATACEGPGATRRILEELSPNLANTVDEKNAKFAMLAAKEKDGTLTVQERADYENDPWRAVPYRGNLMYRQLFSETTETSELSSVVTSCSTNGFKLGRSGYDSYCETFAQLAVIYRFEIGDLEGMRWAPNVLVLSEAQNDLFDRLRRMGKLSARMEELRAIAAQDGNAREAAEEEVASSSALDILADEVDDAIAAKYSELRCKSWASELTTPPG